MGGNRNMVAICSEGEAFTRAMRLVLDGLEVTVGRHPGEAASEADLVIWRIDNQEPRGSIQEVVRDTPTLVLARGELLLEAVDAGCRGFLELDASLDEIATATHTILAGGAVIPPNLLGRVLQHLVERRREHPVNLDLDSLTDREQQVFELAAQGLRKEAIGERLFISPATARTHLQRVYKKLGVHSQAELISIAHNDDRPEGGMSSG